MGNIRFIKLDKGSSDAFSHLDPYEKLRLLDRANGFAIGVIGQQKGNMYPAGLLCGQLLYDSVCVEWLSVDINSQGEGVGEGLLIKAYNLADAYETDDLTVMIPASFEKEPALRGSDRFFKERLFNRVGKACADTELTVSEIQKCAGIKALSGNAESEEIAVQKILKTEEEKIFNSLASIEIATFSVDIDLIRHQIDRDISVIVKGEKRIEGAFLVQKAGNLLIPVYLHARSKSIRDAMFLTALAEAEKKYGKNQMVSVSARQEETKELIEELFGYYEEASILTASLSDYKKEIEAD